jgi:hypothetical protein
MAVPVKDLSTRRGGTGLAFNRDARGRIAHGSAIDDHVSRTLYQLGQSMQVRVLGMDKGPYRRQLRDGGKAM